MSGPSEKALEPAARAWCGSEFFAGTSNPDAYDGLPPDEQAAQRHYARSGLRAAHDSALGLDRSVCLRDVVEFLQQFDVASYPHAEGYAKSIAVEFGGGE